MLHGVGREVVEQLKRQIAGEAVRGGGGVGVGDAERPELALNDRGGDIRIAGRDRERLGVRRAGGGEQRLGEALLRRDGEVRDRLQGGGQ